MAPKNIKNQALSTATAFTIIAGSLMSPISAFALPQAIIDSKPNTQTAQNKLVFNGDITLFDVISKDNTTGDLSLSADNKQYDPAKTSVVIPESTKKTGLNIKPEIPSEGYLVGSAPGVSATDLKFSVDTSKTEQNQYGNADLQIRFSGPGEVYVYDLNNNTVSSLLTHTGYKIDPKGEESIHINKPQKKSTNWLFTKPGKYTFTVTPKMENSDYDTVNFPSKTYTVEVGDFTKSPSENTETANQNDPSTGQSTSDSSGSNAPTQTDKLALEAEKTELKGGEESRFVARGMGHDDYVVFYVDGIRQDARGYQPWPIDGHDGVTFRYAFPTDATGEHTIGFTNGATLRHKKSDSGVKYTELKVTLTPGKANPKPPVSETPETQPDPETEPETEPQENPTDETPDTPTTAPINPAPVQPPTATPSNPTPPTQPAPPTQNVPAATPAQPATAPNDTNLTVATSHHVDAPRVFFENGSFTLKSEFDGSDKPLDSTINYFTHRDAVDRFGEHFTYDINNLGPKFDFMAHSDASKRTNTVWYTAPAVAGVKNAPIFSGFGAAADVPVSDFRDGSFTLDLVSVEGPGQMELFADSDPYDSTGVVQRLFSSSDIHHRSFVMEAGNHTHNYTAFSKPGRYILKYRASARTKEGKLILGDIQTLQWQVGGNKPGIPLASESDISTAKQPTFSVSKTPVRTVDDTKKHGQLRTIRVDLGTDTSGTAEFTIDGHHLATVKVTHGVAEFSEALSADVAKLQVQVKTDKISWTSAALEVDPASEATVQTTDAGSPLAKTNYPSPVLPSAESSVPNDFNATITLSAGPVENTRKVTVDFPSSGYYGNIVFEGYDKATSTVPNYTEFFNVTGEKTVSFIAVANDMYDGGTLRATFTPHAITKNAQRTNIKIVEGYTPGQQVTSNGKIPTTPVDTTPSAVTSPTTTPPKQEPAPNQPSTPTTEQPITPGATTNTDARLLITRGHLDIQALNAPDGGIDIKLKDDSTLFEKKSVVRDFDTFALVVPEEMAKPRNFFPQSEAYDEIINKDTTYYIPPFQADGVVWPGYSTENLSPYPETPVKLELIEADGPGDATIYNVDIHSKDRKPIVHLGTGKNSPHSITMTDSTHMHAAWAFTEPGVYSLKLRYSTGDKHSATKSLIFLVGDKGIKEGAPARGKDIQSHKPTTPNAPVVTPNAPTTSQQPEKTTPAIDNQILPSVKTDKRSYTQGAEATVFMTGFAPNSDVKVVLHSAEIQLGTYKADANGNIVIKYTIPADFEIGKHQFIGIAADGKEVHSAEFEVTGNNSNPLSNNTDKTTTEPDKADKNAHKSLAATGVDSRPLGLLSMLVLALGLGLRTITSLRRKH